MPQHHGGTNCLAVRPHGDSPLSPSLPKLWQAHESHCERLPIACPPGCGAALVRGEVGAHADLCPCKPVACAMASNGATVARVEMAPHNAGGLDQRLCGLIKVGRLGPRRVLAFYARSMYACPWLYHYRTLPLVFHYDGVCRLIMPLALTMRRFAAKRPLCAMSCRCRVLTIRHSMTRPTFAVRYRGLWREGQVQMGIVLWKDRRMCTIKAESPVGPLRLSACLPRGRLSTRLPSHWQLPRLHPRTPPSHRATVAPTRSIMLGARECECVPALVCEILFLPFLPLPPPPSMCWSTVALVEQVPAVAEALDAIHKGEVTQVYSCNFLSILAQYDLDLLLNLGGKGIGDAGAAAFARAQASNHTVSQVCVH